VRVAYAQDCVVYEFNKGVGKRKNLGQLKHIFNFKLEVVPSDRVITHPNDPVINNCKAIRIALDRLKDLGALRILLPDI
jgi:hypothetical protein